MGTACYVRWAKEILNAFESSLGIKPKETTKDGNFTLEASRCVGACGLAPVFCINDEVHGSKSTNDSLQILEELKEHVKGA